MKRVLSIFLVIVLTISVFPIVSITTGASCADDIVSNARTQIGSYGSDTNKFTSWYYGKTTNAAWCAIFVSWCANQTGVLGDAIPKRENCASMLEWFKNRGEYYTVSSSYVPQKGDIIFFDTDGSGVTHHVEIVAQSGFITENGKTKVRCIGGNTSNSSFKGSDYVSEKNRYIYQSSCKVMGYAHPSYDDTTDYTNYTYSFNFNANGGTLDSSGAFNVSYGNQFEILNTTCTRSGYTWAGWNVKRNNDSKWYVDGQGWCTESQISSNGYVKKAYSNYSTYTLDDSWTSGIDGNCSYTFYAVWIQSRSTKIRCFVSPYGEGYDHITALNNSSSSGFAQEFIYAWYILYDGNTGELLNTYSDANYSVELAVYDPNGDLVFKHTYTGSNDANWIGVTPEMSGTYTATATISGDYNGSHSTTYEVSYDAELLASSELVSLNLNGTNSQTIAITPIGGYPGEKNATVYYNGTYVSVSSRWSNGQILVTLNGLKVTNTSLRVDLYENYTGNKNVVATITIPVEVTANSYTITYNANGGSGAPASQSKVHGTDIALSSTIPTGKSYTVTFNGNGGTVATSSKTYTQSFSGWNTYQSGEGTNYAPGSIFSSNVDVTMYAQWKNPKLDNITQPTRSDYYFMGWYDSAALNDNGLPEGKRYMPNTSITSNVTLYAMWSKSPTIMYGDSDLNGVIEPIDITRFNRYIINGTTDDEILFRGDVDADGDLDSTDVTYINNVRIGEISYTSLPAYQKFDGFYINGYPKRTYEYGETFDSSGLSCYVCYTTGTCYIFSNNLSVSGYDPYKIGTQTVTVNYYQYSTTFTVTVKPPQYTIYYDTNGGSVSSTGKTVTYGNSIGTLPTPTREGYTFLGWSFTNSDTNYVTSSTTYSYMSNKTLYALWKPTPTTLSVNSTNNAVISTGGEMKYYTFTPSSTGTYVIYSTGSVDSMVYLYNANGTQITYDDDGNGERNFRLEYDLTANVEYTFGVRCYNSTTTGTVPFTFGRVYTINYNANGGTGAPSSQKKDYGKTLTLSSTEPTRSGYKFLGWSISSTATSPTYQSGDSFISNSNTTLYAIWSYPDTTKPTASISSTNDIASSQTVTLTMTDNVGVVSYYWGTSSNPEDSSFTTITSATSKTVEKTVSDSGMYYLIVKDAAGNVVTTSVMFYETTLVTIIGSNVGTQKTVITKSGNTITLPTPTRSGYTFKGWSTSKDATSGINALTVSENKTYYSIWKYNNFHVSISVTNDVNSSQTVTLTMTDNLIISGYYWGTNSSTSFYTPVTGGPTSYTTTETVSDSGTYYLIVWDKEGNKESTSVTLYKTTLNATGGSVTPTSILTKNGNAVTLPTPTRNGYKFLGWATSSTATSATYQPGDVYTTNADSTLYAVWKEVVLSSISVYSNPNKLGYYLGDSFDSTGLKIKLTYSDGSTEIITSGFTVSGFSSTTSGTKTVTVSYGGKTTTFTASVVTPYITLSSTSKSMVVGDTSFITATTTPFAQSVIWTSSNINVATVSNGIITAKTSGTATITAKFTYNGVTYSKTCSVTVKEPEIHTHSYGDWIIDTNATCTEDGLKHKTCSGCGDVVTETIVSNGHNYLTEWTIDVTPTCTLKGSKSHHCSICGNKADITVIEALGHNYIWEYDYEGLSKTGTCSVCGDVSVKSIAITDVFTFTLNSDGTGYVLSDCISDYCGAVVIPEEYNSLPVTAIGKNAFRDCAGITSVYIPDSVTGIGGSAFMDCTSLKEIRLPQYITSIPGSICQGCTLLESVTIPDSVYNIGGYAFSGCVSLVDITLPGSLKIIGNYAFNSCTNLKDVYYDEFKTNWESISIGTNNDGLTNATIHYKTAEHNYSEWVITVVPTCTEDGSRSKTCSNCGDVVIETIIAHGHNYVKQGTEKNHPHTTTYQCSFCEEIKSKAITISDCVECNFTISAIDSSSYKLVSYIATETDVVIPATYNERAITTVANSCFKGNTTITSVKIADGVTTIGSLVFMNCTSLEKVTIPASVTSIGSQAFYGFTGVIYCTSGSYAHEYAVANNIDYVLVSIMETKDTMIDYDNLVIYTSIENCDNIADLFIASENVLAIPTASHTAGNLEFYGTGTIITVFDGNDYIGDFTLVVEGDTNGDSVCDALDAAQVALVSNGQKSIDGAYALAADSNQDDEIDIIDYQAIVNKVVA